MQALATEPTDLCFLAEAARVVRRSQATLRHWADSGRVPSTRIGKVRVFKRSDLERIASQNEAVARA